MEYDTGLMEGTFRTEFLWLLITTIVIVAFTASVDAQLADSSWPMLHGGAQHGGLSTIDTSHVNGTVKWKFNIGTGMEASPVIGTEGTIYIGAHDSNFYAINPDGTLKWMFDAGEPEESEGYPGNYKGIQSTAAIDSGGTIYFTSLADYLFALDPDGTLKWEFRIERSDNIWSSPVIGEDGTIYVGSYSENVGRYESIGGRLYAINPNGTLKWFYQTESHVAASPAIGHDGTIYSGAHEWPNRPDDLGEGKLLAITSDGTLKWKFTTEDWQESSPSVGPDGTVYIGSKAGKVYAIYPDGTEKWIFQAGDGVMAIPAIGHDGTVYVGSWDYNLYALDKDGTEKWHFTTPPSDEGVSSSVAIGGDGTLYFGSNSGYFYALDPDGNEKWNFKGPMIGAIISSPAIGADGTVYVGSWDGNVYAFSGPAPEESPEVEINETAPQNKSIPGEDVDAPDGDPAPAEESIPIIYIFAAVAAIAAIILAVSIARPFH